MATSASLPTKVGVVSGALVTAGPNTALVVYKTLATLWPRRFRDDQLAAPVSLGSEGLGLDSIEIVELLFECEEAIGTRIDIDALLEAGPMTLGDLIDRLART